MRNPSPDFQLTILAPKSLAHRLHRACMAACTDRSPAVRDALDLILEGKEFPSIVASGYNKVEPKDQHVSITCWRKQSRAIDVYAREHSVGRQDVLRAAVRLACERIEARLGMEAEDAKQVSA